MNMHAVKGVHSGRTELNRTDLQHADPLTRRVIGHARQRHEDNWLQFAKCTSVQFSSVQFICCEHDFTQIILDNFRNIVDSKVQRSIISSSRNLTQLWASQSNNQHRTWHLQWKNLTASVGRYSYCSLFAARLSRYTSEYTIVSRCNMGLLPQKPEVVTVSQHHRIFN